MQQLPDQIFLIEGWPEIILVFNIIISFLLCFFGYNIWRVLLAFAGFGLGLWGGSLIGVIVAQSTGKPHAIWIIALICAVTAAALLANSVLFGTFLASAWWGFALASGLAKALGAQIDEATVIGICSALVVGCATVATGRGGLIVFCSLVGGLGMLEKTYGLLLMNKVDLGPLQDLNPTEQAWVFLGAGLLLGVIGMVVQFTSTRSQHLSSDTIVQGSGQDSLRAEGATLQPQASAPNSPPPPASSSAHPAQEETSASNSGESKASPPGIPPVPTTSLAQESEEVKRRLDQLEDLRAAGLISEDELKQRRQDILSETKQVE